MITTLEVNRPELTPCHVRGRAGAAGQGVRVVSGAACSAARACVVEDGIVWRRVCDLGNKRSFFLIRLSQDLSPRRDTSRLPTRVSLHKRKWEYRTWWYAVGALLHNFIQNVICTLCWLHFV